MADFEAAFEAERVLATEHQRQAKLIVMEAIAAAERRGRRQGWQMALDAAQDQVGHFVDGFKSAGSVLAAMDYPEKE